MDKHDPENMIIHSVPGKELKMAKDTVHLILGLPSVGGGKSFMDWYGDVDVAGMVRKYLIISKDEFGIATLQDRCLTYI